jgi:hypothetical protein
MIISSTPKTPYINFDQSGKKLELKGISCPENPVQFYTPLFEELKKFTLNNDKLDIIMQLDYFNTGSSKCLLNLFQIIVDNQKNLENFKITWITEEGDDELKEAGKIFEEMSGIKFEYENSIEN